MADSSFGRPEGFVHQSAWTDLLAKYAFGGFLFLVFVGLDPFATRDSVAAQLLASGGEGNPIRQISYIITFVIVVGLAFAFRGQGVLRAFPVPLIFVLLWCVVSISWAIDPSIATRRLLLAFILVSCVMCSVDLLGSQRALNVLRFVMAAVLVVNCASLFIVPQAVHLPGELENELAGNWRGLYFHKNIAGPITALSALVFFHYCLTARRWRDWALFGAAVVFLVGTQSKTAIGFFAVAIVIASIYRAMGQTAVGRQIFRYLFVAMLVAVAIAWLAAYETIAELMADPGSFTGRVAIWQTVFTYLNEHWLLGAGFGSFWQIGDASPTLMVSSEKWIQIIPHSHNGYLEIMVTTGIFGLILSIVAFIIIPTKQLLGRGEGDTGLKSLLLSLVLFTVLANLLETIFLNQDRPEWVVFLIVLAILHQINLNSFKPAKPSIIRNQPWRKSLPSSQS